MPTVPQRPLAPEPVLRPAAPGDTDRIVSVWRAAVEATHHFLSPTDIDGYAERLPGEFLPQVAVEVAEMDGEVVGFSGIAGSRLEMLFVHPDAHGRGVGSALIRSVLDSLGTVELDVNEQNPNAVAFYRNRGFEIVGRSPLDGDGKPFPLLHMLGSRKENA